MRKFNEKRIIVVGFLTLFILVFAVGFSAFSSILDISANAYVSPDDKDFSVVFSSSNQAYETNDVIADVVGAGVTSTPGLINNSINKNPRINNLSANFIEPGQKATYSFYVYNNGEYDAYLTRINFDTVSNNKAVVCNAGENATLEYVNAACEGISYTITVGSDSASETSTISNHKLRKGAYENVTVVIEYKAESARSDGPFQILFGDISLDFTTVSDYNRKNENIEYIEGDGTHPGDQIKIGNEEFVLLENDGTNAKLLRILNLDPFDIYYNNKYIGDEKFGYVYEITVDSDWSLPDNPSNVVYDINFYDESRYYISEYRLDPYYNSGFWPIIYDSYSSEEIFYTNDGELLYYDSNETNERVYIGTYESVSPDSCSEDGIAEYNGFKLGEFFHDSYLCYRSGNIVRHNYYELVDESYNYINDSDIYYDFKSVLYDTMNQDDYKYFLLSPNIIFANSNYWYDNGLKPLYGQNYPSFVYNSNSNLYNIVEDYVDNLNSLYGVNATGSILSYEDYLNFEQYISGLGHYWLGSASNDSYIYASRDDVIYEEKYNEDVFFDSLCYSINYLGECSYNNSLSFVFPNYNLYNDDYSIGFIDGYGIKPVITVSSRIL